MRRGGSSRVLTGIIMMKVGIQFKTNGSSSIIILAKMGKWFEINMWIVFLCHNMETGIQDLKYHIG